MDVVARIIDDVGDIAVGLADVADLLQGCFAQGREVHAQAGDDARGLQLKVERGTREDADYAIELQSGRRS